MGILELKIRTLSGALYTPFKVFANRVDPDQAAPVGGPAGSSSFAYRNFTDKSLYYTSSQTQNLLYVPK